MGTLHIEGVTDPYEALCLLAGEAIAIKDQLRQHVEQLPQLRYKSKEGSEQLRAEVQVYGQMLRDAVSVCATLARLQLDDRAVRIKEQQALLVQAALLAELRQAGLTPIALQQARQGIARRLRLTPNGSHPDT